MPRAEGFTLLELLVVIAIISVTLAVVGPRLAGRMEGAGLRDGASDLQVLAKAGRARAALTGKPVALAISSDGKRFRLLAGATEDGPWEAVTPARALPDKVQVKLLGPEVQRAGAQPLIRFLPDGSADEAALLLRDAGGDQVRLEMAQALGRLQLVAQP